ncbi:Uncharacterised protein [uncultured archaeon]|nr:Uncharacterised protein [uncultured archaeon]
MLVLPEALRGELHEPFGPPVTTKELLKIAASSPKPLVSVGDECLSSLISGGIVPDIMVFDFKVKRKEISQEMKKRLAPFVKEPYVVLSDAGRISDDLLVALDRVLGEGRGAIFVVGEDDLSALVIMAYAKSGPLVSGQPDVGAVVVPLGDEGVMERAAGILSRMQKA